MTDPVAPPRRNSRKRKLPPLAVDARGFGTVMSLGLRTIRTLDAAGKLPTPFRCGARKLWSVDEIRAWIKAGAPDRATWDLIKNSHT